MKPRLPLLWGLLTGLLALVLLLGSADTARADFNPDLKVTLNDSEGGANSDFTTSFSLPKGDVNFAGLVVFIPTEWGITPGDEIPIGAIVGKLSADVTLGLINGACNNELVVEFTFLNSSTDPTDTVSFTDEDDNGTEDYAEDKDGSGLQDGFEKYPEFITRVLVDEDDEPLTPIRRSAGITIVAGATVLLQFLVFEPGTFINENIPNDESLGFPTVTLLQNAGDEEAASEPGPITDFCTSLTSTNVTFGISMDNACTDSIPLDQLDPVCEVTSAPLLGPGGEVTGVGGTDPDEGGQVLFTNPSVGSYTFTTIGAGLRDADGDGYENFLDVCPFDVNVGDPRIGGDGDEDLDGLDAACDPDDGRVNSDEDLDGYLNRQDNCPLDANGEDQDNQMDTDSDQIGDACDPNPDDADAQGEIIVRETSSTVQVGPGGAPAEDVTPVGDGDGDDDGDGGSGSLIIIIVVIAAVIVLGGGAFVLMRRSGGGGA